MNVSDTCNAAADLIEVRGWTKGTGWNEAEGSPLCAEGALAAAAGITEVVPVAVTRCPAYLAVRDYLDLGPGRPVFVWNDTAGRTAEQVIATLRAVAVIHAARENEGAGTTRTVEAVSA